MSEKFQNKIIATTINGWQEGVNLVERLFEVASPRGVFSEPVAANGKTVITAAEVSIGMGFGYGVGGGGDEAEEAAEATDTTSGMGFGGGGGGGGASTGRPIAAIIISEDGVRVEPIVDPTKIALAFFTMIGSFLLMLGRMKRRAEGE